MYRYFTHFTLNFILKIWFSTKLMRQIYPLKKYIFSFKSALFTPPDWCSLHTGSVWSLAHVRSVESGTVPQCIWDLGGRSGAKVSSQIHHMVYRPCCQRNRCFAHYMLPQLPSKSVCPILRSTWTQLAIHSAPSQCQPARELPHEHMSQCANQRAQQVIRPAACQCSHLIVLKGKKKQILKWEMRKNIFYYYNLINRR